MAVFWSLTALMTAAALAFVLVPLLRPRFSVGPSAVEANLAVLRGQRREIDADIAQGTLPGDAREEALSELEARAQRDLESAALTPAAPRAQRAWIPATVVALALPALAFGLYLALGVPRAADPRLLALDGRPLNAQQVVAMVEQLAVKVRARPGDVKGWALLARSLGALGRFDEAAAAYQHLAQLEPRDAQVLADYADALAMAQGRSLAGRPYELARAALAIDPRQPKALALAGTAALDAGDYAAALRYWQRLEAQLPADSEDAAEVRSVIEQARTRAAALGNAAPAPGGAALAPGEAAPAAAAKSITGSVNVAPALASRVKATDTLFVFARSEGGPRIPLAVLRTTARGLPLDYTLDDSQAMAPQFRLSGAAAVRIEARISRSGSANPQPGDLAGTSGVVKPGARGVDIVIDKVLP
jgi:cytochrome c-type biogenesis protein CcmH